MNQLKLVVLGVTLFLLSSCGGLVQKPKTYNQSINPAPSLSASRKTVSTDLKIIIDKGVTNPFILKRSNDLVNVEVNNFREAIGTALSTALKPQFNNVTVESAESGTGLELVVLGANYPDPVDVLAYHFALMNDGKLAYELKESTEPITKIVQMSAANWQDETAKLTIEFLESNINQMSEKIRDALIINEKLNDLWATFDESTTAE